MKRTFRRRVVIGVMSLGLISGSVSQLLAQDAAPQAPSDLAVRIDSLEKQLADLKSAENCGSRSSSRRPGPRRGCGCRCNPGGCSGAYGLGWLARADDNQWLRGCLLRL
jgi:hypothetical protein